MVTDSDSDSNDTDDVQDVEAPATVDMGGTEKPYKVAVDCPIFTTSADDTGSLQTCNQYEDQADSEFLMKLCCHLKCTQKFSKDVVKNRQSARELNYYSEKEHVNVLHVNMLGSLNCCVGVGDQTNYAKNKNMPRVNNCAHFYFHRKPVCKEFSFLAQSQ